MDLGSWSLALNLDSLGSLSVIHLLASEKGDVIGFRMLVEGLGDVLWSVTEAYCACTRFTPSSSFVGPTLQSVAMRAESTCKVDHSSRCRS